MKNVEFVIGLNNSGIYDSAREFINDSKKNDIVIFDINSVLERYFYKKKITIPYNEWILSLKRYEIIAIFVNEVNKRLVSNNLPNNIIISGDFTFEEVELLTKHFNIENREIILIDTAMEILYRNHFLNGNICTDLEKFVSATTVNKNALLSCYPQDIVSLYKRININDNLSNTIGKFFGYSGPLKEEENYMWPIVPEYRVLKHDYYGIREKHMILGKEKFHSGFDITAKTNTPIKAATNGVIVYSGLDDRIITGQSVWNQRYGNLIELVDNFGRRQIYAHLREIFVKEGDKVNQSDIIALSGCSGGARVPHLHYEIRSFNVSHSGKENTIDPLSVLPNMNILLLDKEFDEKPYDEIWRVVSANPWALSDKDISYANSKKLIR